MIIFSVGLVVLLRLYCLRIALENEEKTVFTGGIEDSIHNVRWLLVAHMVFYFSCLCETLIKQPLFDWFSGLGFVMLFSAMATLYYLRRLLGDKLTVGQLFGETYHPIHHWLFQTVRHPNIFLIIIPELVGLALLCHAKYSLIFLFPIYMRILHGRIREENLLVKETVA